MIYFRSHGNCLLTREHVAYGVASCIEIESTKKIQKTRINKKKSPKY
jgi:hypothetical protein